MRYYDQVSSVLLGLGRALIASLFILGAINKVINYEATLNVMAAVGLEPAVLLLPTTIVLEFVGGLFVMLALRFYAIAALALALFTVATNIIFHNFWSFEGQERTYELSLFFKNVVVVGALLYVAGNGIKRDLPG